MENNKTRFNKVKPIGCAKDSRTIVVDLVCLKYERIQVSVEHIMLPLSYNLYKRRQKEWDSMFFHPNQDQAFEMDINITLRGFCYKNGVILSTSKVGPLHSNINLGHQYI